MAGSGRSSLAAAARRLIDQRLVPVEELGVAAREYEAARAARERAAQAEEDKAAEFRVRYARARAESWTPSELRELGLEPPPAPRRRRETEDGSAQVSAPSAPLGGSAPRPASAESESTTAPEAGAVDERMDGEATQ